jgi:maltose alpha-D-glucosyltransferase/alpha-amylase
MLRSFDYAVNAALARVGPERADAQSQLERAGREWQAQAERAFLDGYEEVARAAGLSLPRGDGRGVLELMLLEKAFYELCYELDNRPDWVRIPLRGLSDILGPGR